MNTPEEKAGQVTVELNLSNGSLHAACVLVAEQFKPLTTKGAMGVQEFTQACADYMAILTPPVKQFFDSIREDTQQFELPLGALSIILHAILRDRPLFQIIGPGREVFGGFGINAPAN